MSEDQEQVPVSLWDEFNNAFPEDEDCFAELCRRAMELGLLTCRYCGAVPENQVFHERSIRCHKCKKEIWLTAGTFFARMRVVKPWLAAIWLMEKGIILNSSQFHKLAGIAQSSAWLLLKKITLVLAENMDKTSTIVPSSVFRAVIGKRSRETPARRAPLAEQEEIDRQPSASGSINDSTSQRECCASAEPNAPRRNDPSLSPHQLDGPQKEVYQLLSAEPTHIDVLYELTNMSVGQLSAALMMLELAKLVTPFPGDRYSLTPRKINSMGADALEDGAIAAATNFTNMVCSHWRAISRKYLQLYLAAHWFHVDIAPGHGALMDACAKFGSITREDILAYVSPALVRLTCVVSDR